MRWCAASKHVGLISSFLNSWTPRVFFLGAHKNKNKTGRYSSSIDIFSEWAASFMTYIGVISSECQETCRLFMRARLHYGAFLFSQNYWFWMNFLLQKINKPRSRRNEQFRIAEVKRNILSEMCWFFSDGDGYFTWAFRLFSRK